MSNKKHNRKILLVSGSRGEYGYIRPILKLIKHFPSLEAEVLATNMHLLPEFGNSIHQFKEDKIAVDQQIYMALAGYTDNTMVKSLGVFMLSMADLLNNKKPDVILIAGDRGEQLVAAIAGAHMNIPVAHIQAGERSGNVDGLTRHAIARFAHIHFASNKDAQKRLVRMGEQPFRIFRVGAPQLDEFAKGMIASPAAIAKEFLLDLRKPLILVVQHPVTEQASSAYKQMSETMRAVVSFGYQTIVIYPNNDAGSMSIQESIEKHRNINITVKRNVSREIYGGIMNAASVIVGNSSSGIIEAPYFKLPAVNIGRRQEGRLQGRNVVNVKEHDHAKIEKAIRRALSKSYRASIKGMDSPYGDGEASEKILKILEAIPINEKLLFKQITY